MGPWVVKFVFCWYIISWIEYFAFRNFLKKDYPTILSWLKGGPYYQKKTFYFFPLYNVNRAFDLIFQKPTAFSKGHIKETGFLEEYQDLIKDNRFIFEKTLNYIYLVSWVLLMAYVIGYSVFFDK